MTKLVSHRTTETLPSGTTITKLHLTPEGRQGLSTNGVSIPPQPEEQPAELTIYDHKIRHGVAATVLHLGTAAAMVLALLGVSPVFCAALPAAAFSVPTILWGWRDLRAIRRRRQLREGNP